TLSVENTTDINSDNTNHQFKIYPNPTKEIVHFSEIVNVQVTNALGQIVLIREKANMLDIGDKPAGIYFLTLTDDKRIGSQHIKIVKE
ncbi:MAG TPA: T9SS type A sorting domain-containing protein, partial [Chitinophagales bacterium]